ncbi:tol-pal system protein YbgF [uncultured Roseovarius sp.]|uniref:tol-pal system protein YbgF n=1 Tax=uncultured Roseovarius sp. TaxID=293344 RepID=UPI00260F710A|nr:tol-pal system protein YbgF [uncultured Roseovarius sp.]
MRRFVAVLALVAVVCPAGAWAQNDETLADIRQELSILYVEIQRLKRELSTTGATGDATVGGSALDRLGAIESELQRLTSKTEQLEFRIDKVVTDGTNRVGDLEFRLCELESGCDVATLEPGSTLGGIALSTNTGTDATLDPVEDGPELAVGEKADFDAAEAAMTSGNYADAAARFEAFQQAYPGSPLSDKVGLMRGEALEKSGDLKQAGRAYLDLFSTNEAGPAAPEALYRVGSILGQLGQNDQACVTLGEVGVRFPQDAAVAQAQTKMAQLGCQ